MTLFNCICFDILLFSFKGFHSYTVCYLLNIARRLSRRRNFLKR